MFGGKYRFLPFTGFNQPSRLRTSLFSLTLLKTYVFLSGWPPSSGKRDPLGPLTDNAIQVVWNFDEFQGIGLGEPIAILGHIHSQKTSVRLQIYNTYFSPEPCLTASARDKDYSSGYAGSAVINTAKLRPEDTCGYLGANDNRTPSGFGQPVGLSANLRPDWDIKNTEAGFRWEFRLADFRVCGIALVWLERCSSVQVPFS